MSKAHSGSSFLTQTGPLTPNISPGSSLLSLPNYELQYMETSNFILASVILTSCHKVLHYMWFQCGSIWLRALLYLLLFSILQFSLVAVIFFFLWCILLYNRINYLFRVIVNDGIWIAVIFQDLLSSPLNNISPISAIPITFETWKETWREIKIF